MVVWECAHGETVADVYAERHKGAAPHLLGKETRKIGGSAEPVQRHLDRDLPCTRRADIDLVVGPGRGLPAETTINDTYDIGVNRSPENPPELIELGRALNRRFLAAEQTSSRCLQDIDCLDRVLTPTVVDDQRAPVLRFGDLRAGGGPLSQLGPSSPAIHPPSPPPGPE